MTYDMTDARRRRRACRSASSTTSAAPSAARRAPDAEGWGLFEHGALGRHDPSGFTDWFTLAP